MFSSSNWNRIKYNQHSPYEPMGRLTIQWSKKCSTDVIMNTATKCTSSSADPKYVVQVIFMPLGRLTTGNLWDLLVHSVDESWRIISHYCICVHTETTRLYLMWRISVIINQQVILKAFSHLSLAKQVISLSFVHFQFLPPIITWIEFNRNPFWPVTLHGHKACPWSRCSVL